MALRALWDEFEAAGQPDLGRMAGEHRAELIGPLWLRLPAPGFLALRGMPFWAGKRFDPAVDGVAHGVNVLSVRGFTKDSIPITATLEGRDVVVRYPQDAAWPWPGVVDRLRVRDDVTLLGMTYGFPLMPPQGLPFLLHRGAISG